MATGGFGGSLALVLWQHFADLLKKKLGTEEFSKRRKGTELGLELHKGPSPLVLQGVGSDVDSSVGVAMRRARRYHWRTSIRVQMARAFTHV